MMMLLAPGRLGVALVSSEAQKSRGVIMKRWLFLIEDDLVFSLGRWGQQECQHLSWKPTCFFQLYVESAFWLPCSF